MNKSSYGVYIETNLAELPHWINNHVLKQAKFALAVALYETARECADQVVQELPKDFVIRNTYVGKGIRVQPQGSFAIRRSASGISGMEARVGTVDDFMARQAIGGVKKGKSRRMGVPLQIRQKKEDLLPKRKWPSALLKKKRTFIAPTGKGKSGLYQRTSERQYPVKLLYAFRSQIMVRPRWDMQSIVENKAKQVYDKNFRVAYVRALATAKK